jgi:uncharacterized protein
MEPQAWNKVKLHLFEFDGDLVAIDVNRGRPHLIQPVEYALLRMRSPIDEERAIHQLGLQKRAQPEQVQTALNRLVQLRLLVSPGEELPSKPSEPDFQEVSTLELNIAEDCNLRCAYCCVGQGGFGADTLSVDMITTASKTDSPVRRRGVMTLEVARKAIDLLMRESLGAAAVHIRFFGGEPTLNWPVIEQSVLYAEEHARAAGKTVSFSIVTNGTLLTRRIIEFMKDHQFWLQISIDGTPEMHNAFRLNMDGTGSYEQATRWVPNLLQAFGPHELQARGTITHADTDMVKAFDHLRRSGFFAPEVRPVTGRTGEYALTAADYLAFNQGASELARRVLNGPADQAGENLALFNPYLSLLMSGQPRRPPCGAGRNMIGVSTDGKLFPCTDMVGKELTGDFANTNHEGTGSGVKPASGRERDLHLIQFGDIQTGLRRDLKEEFLRRVDVDNKTGCRACWARYLCSGACASVQLSNEGGLEQNAGLECIWIRHVIELALWLYLRLLRDRPEVFFDVYGQEHAIDLTPLRRVFAPANASSREAGRHSEPAPPGPGGVSYYTAEAAP